MTTYRTQITIEEPGRIVLTDLPFPAGQRVEIVVIANGRDQASRAQALQALLKETQALPQAQALSEEEIAAEIAAYRDEQCAS
jgi:hypothetical protein